MVAAASLLVPRNVGKRVFALFEQDVIFLCDMTVSNEN